KTDRIAVEEADEIEDSSVLADADSCFCDFNGVVIHHKISDADSEGPAISNAASTPIVLLHGFGASVFSWQKVLKAMARNTGSKVLAFDRPAFGLTSRVSPIQSPLNPYSMVFSALASLFFIDFLAAEKAVLVGHSAGALVALEAYFEAPERVAALILVAPAIFAPLMRKNPQKQSPVVEGDSSLLNPFSRLLHVLSKAATNVAAATANVARGIKSVYKKTLATILRSALGVMAVRMAIGKLGVWALRSAWYDPSRVSDHTVEGYKKPLKLKGWDKALVEYIVAMVASDDSKPPVTHRLSEISCPVMIITGDSDRLVPTWNSRRVSKYIPGCGFQVIENCGHLPQEEKPDEFVTVVGEFLRRKVTGIGEEETPRL
ncbi:hypothetical protein M569_02381, partial [Genlisea aurea]